MDAVLNPDRRGSVKVTYSGRQKRRRDSVQSDEVLSETSQMSEQETLPDPAKSPAASRSKDSSPEKKIKEVTDSTVTAIGLPGPIPKHKRVQSVDSQSSKLSPKSTHSHNSSISTHTEESLTSISKRSSSKPPSLAGARLALTNLAKRRRIIDPEHEDSAESSKSRARGTTEAQRLQIFEKDPECGDIEHNRVFCKICEKWLQLSQTQKYAMANWNMHKKTHGDSDAPRKRQKTKNAPRDEEDDDDDVSSVAPSIAQSETTVRRNESERQALLEADAAAEEVQPHQVLCKTCHKWVKLSLRVRFSLKNWREHQIRCSGSLPSTRVATAGRKMKLVNDAQARNFNKHSVDCASCGKLIALQGEGVYNLTSWEEHKAQCSSTSSTTVRKKAPSSPLRQSSIKPPSSSASTNETAVALEIPSPPHSPGKKRARESEDAEADTENLRNVRPRTEGYEPPRQDAPGPWGWFMLPLKAFVRGFRQGLQS